MKNQYFGDIHDYRKYGLLRSVVKANGLKVMVAWMITPDDGSSDGELTSYLESPEKWNKHDPMLFYRLKMLVKNGLVRRVGLLENTNLLQGAEYYTEPVPDSAGERGKWFERLLARARPSDFVFLDPDNGLEVKSRPYGRKDSSKFLFWHEVDALWKAGKSLLIYQHFRREKRTEFVQRMLAALNEATPGSQVEAFATPRVVFLMALQPEHQYCLDAITKSVQRNWSGQIHRWDQESPPHATTIN